MLRLETKEETMSKAEFFFFFIFFIFIKFSQTPSKGCCREEGVDGRTKRNGRYSPGTREAMEERRQTRLLSEESRSVIPTRDKVIDGAYSSF